jgi:ATP-binding cassette subfamily B protein
MDLFARRLARFRSSPKWQTARLLPSVDRRPTMALAVLVAVTGVLPVVIILTTGEVVGSIPDALGAGLFSPAGRHALVMLAVLGSCFVVQQAASAARAAAGAALGWQLNRSLEQRVMAAVASPAGIGHLEDPVALDQITAARDVVFAGYRPCDAVPAMASRASVWLQGTGAAAVLATYRWWLAVLVFGIWAWRASVLKQSHLKGMTTIGMKAPAVRRSEYLRDLVLTPAAAKEIRVFGLSDWLIDRYRAESATLLEKAAAERSRGSAVHLVSIGATIGVTLLAYVLVGLSAAGGDVGLGGLALYATAIAGIQVLNQVGLENLMLEFGSVPVPAVSALEAGVAPATAAAGVEPPVDAPTEAIRFEGVRFRYPGADHDALTHLDLGLPAGRSVAIVGANGAGKTTLVKLLCRFYEPDGGRITVDGRPLDEFDAPAWQRHVAAVFQDFVRYPVSARDNIAFGAVDRARDKTAIDDAARRAGAASFLEALPQGIGTLLAPGHAEGTDLSGGQWQRVVLARALFAAASGARVLVLDEPAANLDARGEAELYDRFLDITRGVTTVVISHRFSTVRRADLIYVIEHGRVVEQGSHAELMAARGSYARMFTVQADRLLGA